MAAKATGRASITISLKTRSTPLLNIFQLKDNIGALVWKTPVDV